VKRIYALLAALAVLAGLTLAGSPAQASVPEWDKGGTVHSAAEWESIKTVDQNFAHNLPASREAVMRKIAGDCVPRPPVGPKEHLCLWNGWSYNGTMWDIPLSWLQTASVGPNNGISFTGSGINNASKGWWNRTYQKITLYDNESCQNSGFIRDMVAEQFAVSDNAASNDWENLFGSASLFILKGTYCYQDPNQ